jgi:hypothetical protein
MRCEMRASLEALMLIALIVTLIGFSVIPSLQN